MENCRCFDAKNLDDRLTRAIVDHHMDCLISLLKNDLSPKKRQEYCEIRLPPTAAKVGNLDALKFLYQKASHAMCDWVPSVSVENDNLECLKFVIESTYLTPDLTYLCYRASAFGSIECLKYCHGKGGKLTNKALEISEERGHPECVRYIRDNM